MQQISRLLQIMKKTNKWLKDKTNIIWDKHESIYTIAVLGGVILTSVLMYYRAFLGTELTDCAYYVSEAKEILNGNVPFAYNNSSKAVGFTFLLIAIEAIYGIFVSNLEGVFLFCKLCFVTYKIVIAFIVYWILQRRGKKSNALLMAGLLIVIDGYMPLFSYNYVPMFNMFLSGCLLYDAIEHNAPCKKMKVIAAGFLTSIGCFANPGWGVALIVFTVLMIVRGADKKEKIKTLIWFYGAVFVEVLIVFVPIAIQTSVSELWYGLYRLFINPIPVDSMNSNKTWMGVLDSFKDPVKQWLMIFLPVSLITFCFSKRYISEKNEKLSNGQYVTLSVTTAMLLHVLYLCYSYRGSTGIVQLWGFMAFCYMVVFLVIGVFKNEKIVWYLAIYPPIYAAAEIILVSSGANVGRFVNAYTVLIPVLYVLMKNKTELVRIMANLMVGFVIIIYGYIGFHYVYRDDDCHNLISRVESGVYKGNYTTPARAHDLPELEEYLNNIIDEDETYAFRDNVPSAYLMVHKGKVCEMSTWDILQHSYRRNSPAVLFDYYRRRDMIPDKIIYIDFGRDENLSIFEDDYRYNDWVDAYYDLVDDIELNETFFHIMVYQYNGTFDGNYQWWIDNYWNLVK